MPSKVKLALLLFLAALLFLGCHKRRGPERAEPVELTSVEEIYAKGQEMIKKKRSQTARKYFEQITLREDAGDYKDKATVAIADSYFSENTVDAYAEAISRYHSFLAFHAMHALAPYCQYMIGMCYFKEMDSPDRDVSPARNAKESFKKLVENYPSSEYVRDAQEKIKQADDILAAHEIYIGDFYLRDGHPRSAKARYNEVLANYPGYWNLPLVHFRLADAEAADGNQEAAKANLAKVIELVPDSQMARDARKAMETLGKKEAKRSKREGKKLESPVPKPPKEHKKRWWMFWRK